MAVPADVQNYLRGISNYYRPEASGEEAARRPAHDRVGLGLLPSISLGGGGSSSHHTVTHLDGHSLAQAREHQREDKEEARATNAAWLFGIVSVVGSAVYAFVLRDWVETSKELKEAIETKDRFQQNHPGLELSPILDKHIEVLEGKVTRSRNIVLISTGALASVVTGFVAGMFASQLLITIAIVASVAFLAVGAFTAVWHLTDRTDLPEHMHGQIAALLGRA